MDSWSWLVHMGHTDQGWVQYLNHQPVEVWHVQPEVRSFLTQIKAVPLGQGSHRLLHLRSGLHMVIPLFSVLTG